jgi:hypothetical protein
LFTNSAEAEKAPEAAKANFANNLAAAHALRSALHAK